MIAQLELKSHFDALLSRPSVEGDFYYPHIVWMAMEPRVAENPQPFLPLLSANENSVSAYCLRRVMRRICDLTDATAREKHLNAALEFLGGIATKSTLADAALDGLMDAFKSKGAPPTIKLEPIITRLAANPALADKARRLATLLGDTAASRALIAKINDSTASVVDRLKGIQAARETKDASAKSELLKLLREPLTLTLSPPRGEGGDKPREPNSPIKGESNEAGRKPGDPNSLAPIGGEGRGEGAQGPQRLYSAAVQALSVFEGDE